MTPEPKVDWMESAQAWVAAVDRGDANRELLLDPVVTDQCGDVDGREVLDVGCGEGRFCRMLSRCGARVTGLDPTPALIAAARERDPEGTYVEGHAEHLPFPDAAFDVVVSYLSLIDIDGYQDAIREMARVVRPGGRVVIANITPYCSSFPFGWRKEEGGLRLYYRVDHVSFEHAAMVEWAGIRIVNHHRPLGAYVAAFLAAGLQLAFYDEPIPTPEAQAKRPDAMNDQVRVPNFNVMTWHKP